MKKEKQKNVTPQAKPAKPKLPEKKNSLALPLAAIVAVIILAITYISFSPSLKCGFTNWDDPRYVLENPLLKSTKWENVKTIFKTKEVSLNYHPLTIYSLARDYAKAKLDKPEIYHRTNLIFHLCNTFLVFVLIWLFSNGRIEVAGLTALFFGIHPMHVESVTWIAERKDVLYTFFFLLSLIAYLKFSDTKKWWYYLIALLAFSLSLISKAMAVTLPVIMLLMDHFKGRKLEWKVWLEKIPFFILSIVFGVIALTVQSQGAIAKFETFTLFQRIMFACYGAIMYLVKMVVPFKLSAFYPYPNLDENGNIPLIFYLSPFVFLVISGLIIWSLKKGKLLFFGFAFYIVSVAMVLQFISVGSAIMADRYTYIAFIGPFFVLASLVPSISKPDGVKKYMGLRWGLFATLIVAAIVFAKMTYERTQVWENSITLWSDVISKYPSVDVAYKNRGNEYGQNGKHDLAMKDYNVLMARNTKDPDVYTNLGNVYGLKQQYDKAIDAYNRALAANPNHLNALVNRGFVYENTKQFDKAIEDYTRALKIDPNLPRLYFGLANSYLNSGQAQKAIDNYNTVISYEPENIYARLNRGVSYFQLGKFQEAMDDYMQVLQKDPKNGEAWYKASVAAFRMNNMKDAEVFALKAKSFGFKVEDAYLLNFSKK